VVGSTKAQDQQRCPLVQLSSDISMNAGYVRWSGQSGTWKTPGSIILGSWRQNYYSTDYTDVHISNLDGRLAVTAALTSDDELQTGYKWRVTRPLSDFPPLVDLEAQYDHAASGGGREDELAAAGIVPPANATRITYKLLDCDGRLLFVVQLQAETLRPGAMDVFDQSGALVAHSLQDHASARLTFVDPHGYLLATAEAPALGAGLDLRDVPLGSANGGILPYQIRFESGGYANASRLLDSHYRWALASALQVRAVADAQAAIKQPGLLAAISVAYWCLAALALVAILCLLNVMRRSAFPPADSLVWAKRV